MEIDGGCFANDIITERQRQVAFEQQQAKYDWWIGFWLGGLVFGVAGLFAGWFIAISAH